MNFKKCISKSEFWRLSFKKWISKIEFQKINFKKWISKIEFWKLNFKKWISKIKFQKVNFENWISDLKDILMNICLRVWVRKSCKKNLSKFQTYPITINLHRQANNGQFRKLSCRHQDLFIINILHFYWELTTASFKVFSNIHLVISRSVLTMREVHDEIAYK